jgi:hypothetical protein
LGSLLLSAGDLSPMEVSALFHDKLFGSPPSSESENDFLTYQNNSTGITMKYPSEWQKVETKQGILYLKYRKLMQPLSCKLIF